MGSNAAQPRTLIFWGAGATKELGMRLTAEQGRFIYLIAGANASGGPLSGRIADALGRDCAERWHNALFDLITILGDSDDAYSSISHIDGDQLSAMRRNWRRGASDEELRKRIFDLRLTYDWPALKSVVGICPGSAPDRFLLNDLFNLLDMHISPGFGFRAPASRRLSVSEGRPEEQFFDARRLIGAKNALLVILIALFYIDYQECILSKREMLGKYHDFAVMLGRRMQRQGLDLARQHRLDHSRFYQGDVGFVSLNYDPIALWVQLVANRELNHSASVPHIGSPAVPLYLFLEFGHLIPSRRIARDEPDSPWYPMNEAVAQRLNEVKTGGDHRARLTKFLFPHGCLCWRECPDCGKLSAYHADKWDLDALDLFPPPPLRAFDERGCPDRITGKEREQREKGCVDARGCLHCHTLTYAHHTQAVMQSSFKPRPPSFIEEIQRELRATTMRADHIIFMGYSLPLDDVTYRAFFSARRQRGQRTGGKDVHCTVVGWDEENPGWYHASELKARNLGASGRETVNAARDIFGETNVRFYGGGVPNVFLDGGQAKAAKLEQLLTWSQAS